MKMKKILKNATQHYSNSMKPMTCFNHGEGTPAKEKDLKCNYKVSQKIVKEKLEKLTKPRLNKPRKYKRLFNQLNKEAPSNQHESCQLTTQHPPIMTLASLINQLIKNTTYHEPTICVYGSHIDPTKTKEATDIDIRWICKNTEEVNNLAQNASKSIKKN